MNWNKRNIYFLLVNFRFYIIMKRTTFLNKNLINFYIIFYVLSIYIILYTAYYTQNFILFVFLWEPTKVGAALCRGVVTVVGSASRCLRQPRQCLCEGSAGARAYAHGLPRAGARAYAHELPLSFLRSK